MLESESNALPLGDTPRRCYFNIFFVLCKVIFENWLFYLTFSQIFFNIIYMDTNIIIYCLIGVFVIFNLVSLAIVNYAGENLVTIFGEYKNTYASFLKTYEFASLVSNQEFGGKIRVERVQGFLSDYYSNGAIHLSDDVYDSASISAFAVAGHELGHAIQYRDTPKKMKKFNRNIMLSKTITKFTMPLFVIGIVLLFVDFWFTISFVLAAVISFLIGLMAKLSTIKIEKEASQNAIELLKKYAEFDEQSIKYAKKVLSSAKLTYVASFLRSLVGWTMLVKKYDFY